MTKDSHKRATHACDVNFTLSTAATVAILYTAGARQRLINFYDRSHVLVEEEEILCKNIERNPSTVAATFVVKMPS